MEYKNPKPRKVSYVAYDGPDGPENSFYLASSVKDIQMRQDGRGPMGFYDVVYVTHNDGTVSSLPAHNCTEIQFAKTSEGEP